MPAFKNHNRSHGVPDTSGPGKVHGLNASYLPIFEERNYTITDVTKDATGTPLGSCLVLLFNAATNVLEQSTTSDASGNYSFVVDKTQTYWTREYKSGGTPVAGTSVPTLTGA